MNFTGADHFLIRLKLQSERLKSNTGRPTGTVQPNQKTLKITTTKTMTNTDNYYAVILPDAVIFIAFSNILLPVNHHWKSTSKSRGEFDIDRKIPGTSITGTAQANCTVVIVDSFASENRRGVFFHVCSIVVSICNKKKEESIGVHSS